MLNTKNLICYGKFTFIFSLLIISSFAQATPNALQKYMVRTEDFYKVYQPEVICPDCDKTMPSLIERYSIKNKNILSIGSGSAHEEYYFLEENNQLFLVDIDETSKLEPFLKKINSLEDVKSSSEYIQYYIGDFTKNFDNLSDHAFFDVLYMSSYTPHAMWQDAVLQKANRSLWQRLTKNYDLWDINVSTLEPSVVEAMRRYLRHGGLLFIQLYYGAPSAHDKNYLTRLQKDLEEEGFTLLELYHLKESANVQLITAVKAPRSEAKIFYQEFIQSKPKLTGFHGRTKLNKFDYVLSYTVLGEKLDAKK